MPIVNIVIDAVSNIANSLTNLSAGGVTLGSAIDFGIVLAVGFAAVTLGKKAYDKWFPAQEKK